MTETGFPPVRRREIFGWAMFDFANSSYTTLIITVAFSIYFTKVVAGGPEADFLWAVGIGLTNGIVLLLSPLVGAIADSSGRKKVFLFTTYALCVVGTAGLYFATPGRIGLALTLMVISFVAYSFGENFAGAFLPEISTPENIGRVSAFGWGIGYFGGLACLLLARPLMTGLDWDRERLLLPENAAVYQNLRLVWVLTAVFFLLAAIPTFALLKERAARPATGSLATYAREGFARLRETVRSIRHFSELRRFLLVFFFFHAGLMTVVAFAGIFAERTLGFTAGELIGLFLMLQLSSAGGAWLFGWLQDRLGGRRTIQIALVLWIGVCVGSYFCTSKSLFWGIALVAGLGIGSLQSAARAVVGLFSPPEKSAEFYGFWGLAAKAAYFVGPLSFGVVSSATGSQRLAILLSGVFFVVGLIGMQGVDEARGHAEAEAWHQREAADAAPAPS